MLSFWMIFGGGILLKQRFSRVYYREEYKDCLVKKRVHVDYGLTLYIECRGVAPGKMSGQNSGFA